jgi:tripartite-type tricarboxylate transporter receptor subunit TctC
MRARVAKAKAVRSKMTKFCALLVAVLLASFGSAAAEVYPSRVITMVAPFPAGGGTTLLARVVAEQMKAELGQTAIVENIPGAGGTLGVTKVARAAPDGYTLLFGNWASNVGSAAVYPVDYDLIKDFAPIARIADAPLWLVARKDFPANSLTEMLAWLKANPGKATMATVGVGSGSHLCGIYLENQTGLRVQFIPYHGGAPAMQDLIGGHVDMMCDFSSNSLPFYRAGQVKALAVMARHRWFGAPEVPTFEEMGVPGIYVSFWHGLWAPRKTPGDVIAKLNGAIVKSLADPTLQKRFADQGQEIPPRDQQTPEALAAYQKAEIDKWWPIIKGAGIKAQ